MISIRKEQENSRVVSITLKEGGDAYDDSISNVNAYDRILKFGVVNHIL